MFFTLEESSGGEALFKNHHLWMVFYSAHKMAMVPWFLMKIVGWAVLMKPGITLLYGTHQP